VRDLEEMRDKAIADAKAFGDYQLECVQKQYELDSEAVEEEYQVGLTKLELGYHHFISY
jgi:hypothetical protein